jgi:transcriptional regulator with XRE-family HTH domain
LDEPTGQTKKLLASNIKSFRKKWGLSQERLAEAADLSAQTISDIEGCRTWVSDKTLERLAQVLKVAIFELFMPSLEGGLSEDNTRIMYSQLQDLRSHINGEIDKKLDWLSFSENR